MMLSEVAKLAEPPTGPQAEKLQRQINRGKKRSKRLAEASGLLGIGALGLRAPQAANALARRSGRLAATPAIKRLGSLAPHATKLSEASVPLSIGTGALGSFNYAHQIGRENKLNPKPKPVTKSVIERYRTVSGGAGLKHMRTAVMGHDNKVYGYSFKQGHYHGRQDGAWYAHRHHKGLNPDPKSRWNFDTPDDPKIDDYIEFAERKKRSGQLHDTPTTDDVMGAARRLRNRSVATGVAGGTAVTGAMAGGIEVERRRQNKIKARKVKKADDRFLHKHRNYISEGAERAYVDLGERRNRRQQDRSAYLALAGAGVGATVGRVAPGAAEHAQVKLMNATVLRRSPHKIPVPPIRKPSKYGMLLAVPTAAGLGTLGSRAWSRNQEARSLQGRREKIKSKAYERKAAGQYGRPAAVRKEHYDDVAKAIWRARVPGIKPSVRPGGLMRLASGRTVTRRGSIPGTGRFF